MYDEYASRTTSRHGTSVQKWFIRRALNSILKVLDQDLKDLEVLEIGTGMGHFAEVVVAGGAKNYVGIEPNQILRGQPNNLLVNSRF